ncbi:MAG: hypothetical protein KUL77_09875 [Thermomonas sp.]|nr:hypothetical protein [Thermomonas sp.]MBV2209858.1 hypothetical protein [Thermomonas sp.]
MVDSLPPQTAAEVEARRKRAKRTAWLFAGVVIALYAGFITMMALRS